MEGGVVYCRERRMPYSRSPLIMHCRDEGRDAIGFRQRQAACRNDGASCHRSHYPCVGAVVDHIEFPWVHLDVHLGHGSQTLYVQRAWPCSKYRERRRPPRAHINNAALHTRLRYTTIGLWYIHHTGGIFLLNCVFLTETEYRTIMRYDSCSTCSAP